MPNHRMVSGISAATGRLRPNSASGAPADSNDAPRAGGDPERHADQLRPDRIPPARGGASPRCSESARARSTGWGSSESLPPGSEESPARSSDLQTPGPTWRATTPARRPPVSRGRPAAASSRVGERRSANSERGSVGIYFVAGAASAGYTFTSTRRFFALLSGSDASAGRSQPRPAVEN